LQWIRRFTEIILIQICENAHWLTSTLSTLVFCVLFVDTRRLLRIELALEVVIVGIGCSWSLLVRLDFHKLCHLN
jgi:hypothetical protein